ncbi:hypothetical protein ACFVTJ_04115 [Agrobacterium sp. NPDC058088]|uniref:hypothetical protein n=1 Tax=Agrobacterium sp. NPDC058088 TaxID=3346335 RepID=UPI0036D93A51
MIFGEDFLQTDAGQIISGAHRYISAARELRYSKTWEERPTLLQTPTLNMLAHGIELLLKYPLLAGGMSADDVRREFNHDLMKLWGRDENEPMRNLLCVQASIEWEEARASGKWGNDDFEKSPPDELVAALEKLAHLHSSKSGFPLRYIVPPDTTAPRPAFLIDVFGYVAERSTMNGNFPLSQ